MKKLLVVLLFLCLNLTALVPQHTETNKVSVKVPKATVKYNPKNELTILKLSTQAVNGDKFVVKESKIIGGSRHKFQKYDFTWTKSLNLGPVKIAEVNTQIEFIALCPIPANEKAWVVCEGAFEVAKKGGDKAEVAVELPKWWSELNSDDTQPEFVVITHAYNDDDAIKRVQFANGIETTLMLSQNDFHAGSASTLAAILAKDGKVHKYSCGLPTDNFINLQIMKNLKNQLAKDKAQNVKELHTIGHGAINEAPSSEEIAFLIFARPEERHYDALLQTINGAEATVNTGKVVEQFGPKDWVDLFEKHMGTGSKIGLHHCFSAYGYKYWNGNHPIDKNKVATNLTDQVLAASPEKIVKVTGYKDLCTFLGNLYQEDGVWKVNYVRPNPNPSGTGYDAVRNLWE